MCPRCRGSMFAEADRYGRSIVCIACGYALERIVLETMRIDDIDPLGVGGKMMHGPQLPRRRR